MILRAPAAAAFALLLLVPSLAAAQQPNPTGSDAEQRREDRDRAGNPRGKSNWELEQEEREFKAADVPLPAFPKKDGLVEFAISNPGGNRYFVDGATFSIGQDEVLRYTLVIRTSAGTDNVTYEGMRCANGTYRVFAYGNDGKWSPASGGGWRETALSRWEHELRTRYLCPMKMRVRTVAEAMDALRRGGHPDLVNTGTGR